MKEIFDTYVDNALTVDEGLAKYKKMRFKANFEVFLPENLHSNILDVGPGLGEVLEMCKEKGYERIQGVDISRSVAAFLNARGIPCAMVESSTVWLEEHPDCFDMIFMLDVLEHVPKEGVVRHIKACYEALTEHGCMIVMVPNAQAPEGFLHRYNDITHEVGYTPHTLSQILISCGIEHFQCFPFEEYCEEETRWIRDVREEYLKWVRFTREATHNLNGDLLSPEFFAVVYKNCRRVERKPEPREAITAEKLLEVFDQLHYDGVLRAATERCIARGEELNAHEERIEQQRINIDALRNAFDEQKKRMEALQSAGEEQKRKDEAMQDVTRNQWKAIETLQSVIEEQYRELDALKKESAKKTEQLEAQHQRLCEQERMIADLMLPLHKKMRYQFNRWLNAFKTHGRGS